MDPLTGTAFFIALAGILSIEFAISTSILEIMAGVFANYWFNIETVSGLDLLAHLGIVSLMYIAGLEIDLDLVKSNFKSSFTVGFASFFTPFIFVTTTCMLFLDIDPLTAALLGVGLSTTSIAIVYPMLVETTGMNLEGKKILCAAMVTDLLSMAALSLFFSDFGMITIGLILLLSILTYFFPLVGEKIFSYYEGNRIEVQFRLILILILGLAIISEHAGLEAALISFLAGMITSGVVVGHRDLWDKLRFLVFGFLAPVFFFTVGLSVNILDMLHNLPLIAFLFILAFSGKYLGTYLGATRYFPTQAAFMGLLFNERLSLGIIAATFGLRSNLFGRDIYSALIGTILFTALFSALLLKKMPKQIL